MDTIDCPKCEHEHTPTGSHEDDAGEFECDECGFEFIVDIDYDPNYSTGCKVCKLGEWHEFTFNSGRTETIRRCEYCQHIELQDSST